jgi:outer membrane protein
MIHCDRQLCCQSTSRIRRRSVTALTLVALSLAPFSLLADSSSSDVAPATARRFTLPEAVQFATDHYPAVRVAMERRIAAHEAVRVARDNYLPHADTLLQWNRATRNNVAGVLLPQATMPNPSGPVLDSSQQSFWGSAAGMQVSWEPIDFGYRHALVELAQATLNRTTAQIQLTQLNVQTAVADAALTVLATEQSVQAMKADVDRRSVFARSVHALVDAKLRPGADDSRANAELAAARTQMILAKENAAIAKARFAELLGIAGNAVDVVPGALLNFPETISTPDAPMASHPQALTDEGRVLEARARVQILDRSYAPTFKLEGVGYGRGTGAMGTGKPSPDSTQGLLPDTPNWAAGVTVKFGVFDFIAIHSRKKEEVARERQAQQLYAQTMQSLIGQSAQARAMLDGAERIAQNTPIELQASQDAERQARARFQAGLATIVDVAEAQRLLVTAEINDALARLSVWRALEQVSAAQGNLQPFLNLVQQSGATTEGK